MSVPNFIMGIGLMFLFALVLNWFRPEYVSLEQGLGPHLAFLVYPALAIGPAPPDSPGCRWTR